MPTETPVAEKSQQKQTERHRFFSGETLIKSARLLPGTVNETGKININIRSLEETISFIKALEEARSIKVVIETRFPRQTKATQDHKLIIPVYPNELSSYITDVYELTGEKNHKGNETINFPNFFVKVPSHEQLLDSSVQDYRIRIYSPQYAEQIMPRIRKVFGGTLPDNWRLSPRTAIYSGKKYMPKELLF